MIDTSTKAYLENFRTLDDDNGLSSETAYRFGIICLNEYDYKKALEYLYQVETNSKEYNQARMFIDLIVDYLMQRQSYIDA